MNQIFEQRSIRQQRLRRVLASFLVFLMVSDLGFHLVDPFFHSSEGPAGIVFSATDQHPEPLGGCGIPGHEGTPFHHHHFPTYVSQTASPTPLLTLAWVSGIPSFEIVHSSIIIPIGRAPPVRI